MAKRSSEGLFSGTGGSTAAAGGEYQDLLRKLLGFFTHCNGTSGPSGRSSGEGGFPGLFPVVVFRLSAGISLGLFLTTYFVRCFRGNNFSDIPFWKYDRNFINSRFVVDNRGVARSQDRGSLPRTNRWSCHLPSSHRPGGRRPREARNESSDSTGRFCCGDGGSALSS